MNELERTRERMRLYCRAAIETGQTNLWDIFCSIVRHNWTATEVATLQLIVRRAQ